MARKPDTWMPLDIPAYLADTTRLTTEGHGVYLLLLMDYWRNGPPPDDDEQLAMIAKLPAAKWAKYRPIFGRLPFFDIRDGKWHQKRADAERQKAVELVAKRSQAGGNGAAKRWQTHSKPIGNSELESKANGQQTDGPLPSPSPVSEKATPDGVAKKPTKGTRLASDWKPDDEDRGFCQAELGWNDGRTYAIAAEFRDYWIAKPGKDGCKLDWRATWRNWCRREAKKSAPVSASQKPGRPATGERRNAIYASVADELEPVGTAASERGRPESGDARGHAEPVAVLSPSPRGADGAHVRKPSNAAEGIAQDVAGTVGEIPAGRSETGNGSGLGNPQMGDPAEDCPGGGGRRTGRELSAEIEGERRVDQRADSSGMGREGPEDGDLLEIPDFLRRQSA